jgi:hypothetical protein
VVHSIQWFGVILLAVLFLDFVIEPVVFEIAEKAQVDELLRLRGFGLRRLRGRHVEQDWMPVIVGLGFFGVLFR